MKIFGNTDYTNKTPSKHFKEKNSEFKTPKNEIKIHEVCTKYVNNHYAKFEYYGMKTIGVKITQAGHPLLISDGKNV